MTRGGKREGAGRKKGSNKYGEPTKVMRIPESLVDHVSEILKIKADEPYGIPLYGGGVSAGLPLPAEANLEEYLDLNKKLVRNAAATFLVRANGDSMTGAGINDRDLLVVDRSIDAKSGSVIVAAYDGDLMVKRMIHQEDRILLCPENPSFFPYEVMEAYGIFTFGVW